ncbi:hypothetical protein EOM09_06885 [bacterium]|nr:hypothetical protein [bacterium]
MDELMRVLEITFFAGVFAGIISFLAHPLYIISIIKGETIAHPATWIAETLLTLSALIFLEKAGGENVKYVIWGDLLGFIIITILAIFFATSKKSIFRFFNKEALFCLLGVFVGIGVFIISKDPLHALFATLISEFFALWPTIHKVYRELNGESIMAWTFTCLGNAINFFAMHWGNQADMIYVFLIFFIDGVILVLIFRGSIIQRKFLNGIL